MKTTRGPSFPLSLVGVFLLWPLFPRSDSLVSKESERGKSGHNKKTPTRLSGKLGPRVVFIGLREILVRKTGGRKSYQLVRRRVFWLVLVEVAVARPTMLST